MVYPLTLCSDFLGNIWFNLLLKFIVFAGPTFIKLGQWASTRRDLFSPTFCDILGSLHHDAACHSWKHTTQTMQRVFGENWEEWCNIESQDPVHSGCIGQVYKGYVEMDMLQAISGNLSNSQSIDGRIKVAVKVLHPGIMESVDLDLTIMKCVARFLTLFPGVEWLSLPEIILEFELLMKKQIDLKIEAYNLDLFNELFSSDPTIKFPSPIWPLVHSEVLVETFEEGTPISHFTCWKSSFPKSSRLKRRLAKLGISAILKMVFINNFVHADLHPGNIIVQYESDHDKTDPGESNCLTEEGQDLNLDQVRLVFLDAGIVASLSERDLENLQKVFTAIVTNRGDIVGELFLDHATANKCKEPEEFKKAMATLVDNVHKLTLHLGKVQVSGLIGDLFNMLMKHKVKLESNFSSVFLAIMILEGLGRSLDPQLDIIKEARPILLSGVYNRSRSQPHRQTNQSH
ncbi:aarF domain containing kinase 2-like [Apostichopus japonicus]|uniref:AarF domain containing kinase 2-like n=1 Tax=Stichopus japonicus TaxID=307972 RepID=A0A2G8LBX6_STIJA|nr:aarF domain containing kinase 2-like [Apostichopus japonicus]